MSTVYLNGIFLPLDQAHVSVMDRGFLFGDGVYEVIPVYGGKLFRLGHHLRRLQNSLDAVRIGNPLAEDGWESMLAQLVACNEGREFLFDPAKTALLSIDFQRDFIDPEGFCGRFPGGVEATAAIVPRATSSTYVKSRSCRPSPKTVTGRPSRIHCTKRNRLMSGRPPGPYTVK